MTIFIGCVKLLFFSLVVVASVQKEHKKVNLLNGMTVYRGDNENITGILAKESLLKSTP